MWRAWLLVGVCVAARALVSCRSSCRSCWDRQVDEPARAVYCQLCHECTRSECAGDENCTIRQGSDQPERSAPAPAPAPAPCSGCCCCGQCGGGSGRHKSRHKKDFLYVYVGHPKSKNK